MSKNKQDWYRVKVKDNQGKKVLNWRSPIFGRLTISNLGGGRIMIKKRGLFGSKTYTTAVDEAVETSDW